VGSYYGNGDNRDLCVEFSELKASHCRITPTLVLRSANRLSRFDFITGPSIIGSLASHVVLGYLLLGLSCFVIGANMGNMEWR
jgi:hypothetical protein